MYRIMAGGRGGRGMLAFLHSNGNTYGKDKMTGVDKWMRVCLAARTGRTFQASGAIL